MKNYSENIDLIIAKYLSGEATADEALELQDWIDSSVENKRYFQQMHTLYKGSTAGKNFDADSAWLKVKGQLNKKKEETQIIALPGYRKWLRIAAVFALIFTAGLFYYQWQQSSSIEYSLASSNEVLIDTLPLGSLAKLNKNSAIAYNFDAKEKIERIELSGEAYFELAPTDANAIIIESDALMIRDIGTAFNVRAYPDEPEIQVTVEEGEVLLYTSKDSGIHLLAGEAGTYNKTTGKLEKATLPDPNANSYSTRKFRFRDTPLAEVIKTLNRVYEKKIIFNPAIATCRITVSFKEESIENIAVIIAETLNLRISENLDEIVMEGEGCED